MAAKKKTTAKKPVASKAKASAKKAVKKAPAKKPVAKKPAPKAKTSSVAKTLKKFVKKVTSALKVKPKAKPAAKKPAKPVKKVAAKKPVVKAKAKVAPKKVVAKKPVVKKAPAPKQSVKPIVTKVVAKPVVKEPAKTAPAKTISKPTMGGKTIMKGKNEPGKTSYSDAELQEFRELINQKIQAAREELKYLQEQINRTSAVGDTEADTTFSGLEDGTGTMEREYLNQMASRQITYIGHLEKALMRIENKTYGICRETGNLIPKERLRAVPHATLSIEAKMAKD